MSEIGAHSPSAAGGHRRHTALLVDLLGDESPVVVAEVRAELERLGRAGEPALRRASRDGEPRLRGRARQLLLERDRRRAVRRLVRYAARPTHDLERALFLLDAHGAPGEDLRGYRKVLDAFGDEVAKRLPGASRPAAVLADYLGEEVGFAGATRDFHHPDNISLHRAIDRRSGMPLTLSAIYAGVARRAGLRADLLPFPGHVLVAVGEGGGRTVLDPFAGGATVSERRMRDYLAQHGLPARPEFFQAAGDGAMFLRHVTNLIHSCARRGRRPEANDLGLVLRVLARSLDHRLAAGGRVG